MEFGHVWIPGRPATVSAPCLGRAGDFFVGLQGILDPSNVLSGQEFCSAILEHETSMTSVALPASFNV